MTQNKRKRPRNNPLPLPPGEPRNNPLPLPLRESSRDPLPLPMGEGRGEGSLSAKQTSAPRASKLCPYPLLVACLALTLLGATANAGVDEGSARAVPWSGYWWPMREGKLITGPLAKHDKLTGRNAAAWETEHAPSGESVPKWFGYCHAWSASAIMEKEPRNARAAKDSSGREIPLSVGDQKGMLVACHTEDIANTYGQRFTGAANDDKEDLRPLELWRLLRLYVKQQGLPLVLDLDAGEQVWNFPVHAYRVAYAPTGRGDMQQATMTLWFADDGVPPDFVGVKTSVQTYPFTFGLKEGAVDAASAKWVGSSVENHPDFAWYPLVAKAENPEVDYAAVQRALGGSGSTVPNTAPSPAPPPTPTPTPSPRPTEPTPAQTPQVTVDARMPRNEPAPATAQRVIAISPTELLALVTNKTSSFLFDAMADKGDGALYRPGEPVTLSGVSERGGYLYLFLLSDDGSIGLLHPQGNGDNRIPEGKRFVVSAGSKEIPFSLGDKPGKRVLRAIVTTTPLVITGLDATANPTQQSAANVGQQAQQLRLPPRQAAQLAKGVQQFVRDGALPPASIDQIDPRTVIGDFAQDQVLLYVRSPKESPRSK